MSASDQPRNEAGGEREEDRGPHTGNLADEKHPVPLFLRGRSDARQGNDQDEKDGSGE